MAIKKTKLALLVALAVQQLSSPAFAQTSAAVPPDVSLPEVKVNSSRELLPTYNPPTAVSATKIEAPLRDIPQTVNVVPQSVLRDQGVRSMQDVLKAVPGIGMSRYSRSGQMRILPVRTRTMSPRRNSTFWARAALRRSSGPTT